MRGLYLQRKTWWFSFKHAGRIRHIDTRQTEETTAIVIARTLGSLLHDLGVVDDRDKPVSKDSADKLVTEDYLDARLEVLKGDLDARLKVLKGDLLDLLDPLIASKRAAREKEFLSSREAAEYLDITVPTLTRWAREKIVPSIKIRNRTLRFRRTELEEALQQLEK